MQYSDVMLRILSIDSSLSGTGLGRLLVHKPRDEDSPADYELQLATIAAPKKRPGGGHKDMSRRIQRLVDRIAAAMLTEPFDLVVIEEIPYSAQPNHPLVWLWGKIIDIATAHDIPLIVVNVATVKKFAAGKGNAKKEIVMAAMINRYPALGIADNNQADAAALAMIGAHFRGQPVDRMPANHLDSAGLRELELET